jgi:hypothetical protein
MAIFGLGGSESLGDYEDLARSHVYRKIYDFLFHVRLSFFELESSISRSPAPQPPPAGKATPPAEP